MNVSLVIPAHNEAQYLGRCLLSVVKSKHPSLHEIIVVDNASSDTTSEVALEFPGVRVIREDKKGSNHARQKGLEVASGDIIAFVDADTELPEGWFEAIVKEFSKDKKLVCLSGPYKYYDLTSLHRMMIRIYWNFVAYPTYLAVGYMVVGGNFAARRSSLEQIGGFDTTISFYGDDTDVARRLNKVGKVKFKLSFVMSTSGRRFKGQGFFKTSFIYVCNFLSEVSIKRPITKKYKDIR
jgi:glycosyltransferase involved in cell wall biosynthesis